MDVQINLHSNNSINMTHILLIKWVKTVSWLILVVLITTTVPTGVPENCVDFSIICTQQTFDFIKLLNCQFSLFSGRLVILGLSEAVLNKRVNEM